jgi:hypothetical protein
MLRLDVNIVLTRDGRHKILNAGCLCDICLLIAFFEEIKSRPKWSALD